MPDFIRFSVLLFQAFALVASCLPSAQAQAPAKMPIEIVPTVPHTDLVDEILFSPDGQTLVTRSHGLDNTIKLWNTVSGHLLRTISGEGLTLQPALAFSPDGLVLASAEQYTSSLKLWDIATGRVLPTVKSVSRPASLVFSPDGTTVASSGSGGVVLSDVATGEIVRKLDMNPASSIASSIAFSQDGQSLFYINGNKISLWNIETGNLVRAVDLQTASPITRVAFSLGGNTVATSGSDVTIRIWDSSTGKVLRAIDENSSKVSQMRFSGDGRALASKTEQSIDVWDAATGRLLHTTDRQIQSTGRWQPKTIGISPDGRILAFVKCGDICVRDDEIKLWDTASGVMRQLVAGASRLNSLAMSPDGREIAAGDGAGAVSLWKASSGEFVSIIRPLQSRSILSVAFSPDGGTLASAGVNESEGAETIKLWDPTNGGLLNTLPGHTKYIKALSFASDGRTLVSGSSDRTVKVWDLVTRKPRLSIEISKDKLDEVQALSLSPDAKLVATAGLGLKLWDVATGRLLRSWNSLVPLALSFSSNGKALAWGGYGLGIVDVQSGRTLSTLQNRRGALVWAVSFSPDGRILASGDGSLIQVWDVASGTLSRTLNGHSATVRSLTYSRDGSLLISAGEDGTVKIWRAQDGELLVTLIANRSGEWLAITPEGYFSGSGKATSMLGIVRGLDVWSIDQFYQALYRPDLVREKLLGDPRGLVRQATAKLDLDKLLASGAAPTLTITSPTDGSRTTAAELTASIEVSSTSGGVGRIEWRVNGITVGVENPNVAGAPAASTGAAPLRLSRSLVLDEGDNEIEVVAYNSSNLIASVTARARVTAPGPTSRVPPRLVVLSVGLDDYADPNMRLKFAGLDAQALTDAFARAGKGIYENIDVTVLRDVQVTRAGLDAAFTAVASRVRPTDVFVFFAAGHGKTVDGQYYFIPQDFKLAGVESVLASGIPQEQWQQWFAKVAAKKSLLLFDTCESASLTGEGKETRALEQGAASARLVQATGRTIMTAATGDALEGYRGHGLFTYNLIEALGRADGDGNGKIELAELATYVYAQVTALSDQVFKEHQEPQISITGTDYSLAITTDVLGGADPGLPIPTKPTHMLSAGVDLLVQPRFGARRVRKLDTQTPVTLVRTEGGWDLIAREGRPLGYVAASGMAPIQ